MFSLKNSDFFASGPTSSSNTSSSGDNDSTNSANSDDPTGETVDQEEIEQEREAARQTRIKVSWCIRLSLSLRLC